MMPLHNLRSILPALGLAMLIAALALSLRHFSGIAALSPMLGAVLIALLVRRVPGVPGLPPQGLVFASKRVLRLGIVLVGAQVTIFELALLGPRVALIAATTLALTYLATQAAGRVLGVPKGLAQLIGAGTAVCGASAIMAVNSVVRAKDEDVGYAVASITLFGTVLMLILPLLGGMLELSALHYGVWVGSSVHEVAQVAAAGFQFSTGAGEASTITKLMRVMLLAPLVLIIALAVRGAGDQPSGAPAVQFPWFVLGFVLVVILNSFAELPGTVRQTAGFLATFFLTTGMAAMGLSMDVGRMRQRGFAPLLLGAIATCVAVALGLGLTQALLPAS